MALAAGVTAIGAGWGYHSAADLESAGAQAIVLDFPSLGPVLDRMLIGQESSP
jgi:phosphoglycolate phosphatase